MVEKEKTKEDKKIEEEEKLQEEENIEGERERKYGGRRENERKRWRKKRKWWKKKMEEEESHKNCETCVVNNKMTASNKIPILTTPGSFQQLQATWDILYVHVFKVRYLQAAPDKFYQL